MAWLEVETKVRIHNVTELRKKIKKIANLDRKEVRVDDYFALKKKFGKYFYPRKSFRVRKKPDTYEINFKKWLRKDWDSDIVVKKEFEFSIKKKEEVDNLLALFQDLGFDKWVKKKKTSESYFHKKDKRIVIEIHKVERLGYFMEIEYLCQPKEMKIAKKKIKDTLKELGVLKKDIDNTGYTRMLWEKEH